MDSVVLTEPDGSFSERPSEPMYRCARPSLILLLLLALVPGFIRAQEPPQPSEYEIKAAFLFNFAKFTEWPPSAFSNDAAPIIIGTFGGNPFGDALEKVLKGKTLNNRPLLIQECDTVEKAARCHVLFIGASESSARIAEMLKGFGTRTVLTVGESDAFTEAGGMIRFFPDGKKIRFQINDQAIKASDLKISAKLLALASRPSR